MTLLEAYNKNILKINIEISSLCNARCPQCDRTNIQTGKAENWLKEEYWSLDFFKHCFPPHVVSHLKRFVICGKHGEPISNPEFSDICKYIIENSDAEIAVNTNGSLKTEEWWWNLGVITGDRLTMTFAIDGCTQEMHEYYRVNTDLNKILNNMNTLAATKAKIETFTVLFKHNIDHYEEIKQMCLDNGSIFHKHIESTRFPYDAPYTMEFYTQHGEKRILERVVEEHGGIIASDRMRNFRAVNLQYKKKEMDDLVIDCDSLRKKSINMLINSQIYPCCFISTGGQRVATGVETIYDKWSDATRPMAIDPKRFQLKYRSLPEILEDPLYNVELEKSFGIPEQQDLRCREFCGKC
jgi:MoaA/NifB/PqqE/SkfB family radical SAM enzyme